MAKTTYIMPGFEIFGPLQIAFTRMLSDVIRFAVLFFLVRCSLLIAAPLLALASRSLLVGILR